jgi:hypothetical protein
LGAGAEPSAVAADARALIGFLSIQFVCAVFVCASVCASVLSVGVFRVEEFVASSVLAEKYHPTSSSDRYF